eukprot:SAG11_NODE_31483_length_291_cov_1.072917_1_plen_31_part_10
MPAYEGEMTIRRDLRERESREYESGPLAPST